MLGDSVNVAARLVTAAELIGDQLILRLLQLRLGDRLLFDVAQLCVDGLLHFVHRFATCDRGVDDEDAGVLAEIGLCADILRKLLPVDQRLIEPR